MSIAQTHNTALKSLLEAHETDVRRTAIAYFAQVASLEKELREVHARMAVLAKKCNEQEQVITQLRA